MSIDRTEKELQCCSRLCEKMRVMVMVLRLSLRAVFLLFLVSVPLLSQTYDVVIMDGLVVTGDGSRAFKADIGIKNGRIVEIGEIREPDSRKVIDASGLYVCPGFIDIHNHSDSLLLEIPRADNYLLQGVTTIIGGNCGLSSYPLADLFFKLRRKGIVVNFGSLVGHGTIRGFIMGRKRDEPSEYQLRRMKELVENEMREGALGLSTGLVYIPGVYSTTDELVELARIVSKYDGLYASHIRSEGAGISEAVREAIRVGEEASIRVQISHIKLVDKSVWGKRELLVEPIMSARKRGVEVFTDQYPYTASSAPYLSVFPDWARSAIRNRSRTSQSYLMLKSQLVQMFAARMDDYYVSRYQVNPQFEGHNFTELLEMLNREVSPENAAELLIEMLRKGSVYGIFFLMQEEDVDEFMKLSFNMIGSDGAVVRYGEGKPHCRYYGTFPRIISTYVKEKKLFSVEEAVRKMTSLPAEALRLIGRGYIKRGYWADLVVFDLETVKDLSTYKNPHRFPAGIFYVLVNGEIAADLGKTTGVLAGRVLYGPGK